MKKLILIWSLSLFSISRLLLLTLFFFVSFLPVHAQDADGKKTVFFVSPAGNDNWSGRISEANTNQTDGPLKTLGEARSKIRHLKSTSQDPGQVQVYLRGGKYYFDRPLELVKEDSGTEKRPVIYTAYQDEIVRLIAGKEVGNWQPVANPEILNRLNKEARAFILQSDLKSQAITDFGSLTGRGFGRPITPAGLELFFQDKPMTLARWPNTGWVMIDKIPNGANGGRFTYTEKQPGTWAKDDDIWVHGFWTQDWADSYERIKSIDAATRTIETLPPHGVYGYSEKHRYYVLNVFEELDSPGEWYLDRKNGMLYFWPPVPMEAELPIVSVADSVLLMEDCSYVTFRGMTIECTRGTAVQIHGGTGNHIEDCILRNIGNRGVAISGGLQNGVKGCSIYETGDGGIYLSGGDKRSLTAAGNFAENNHIHHFNRWCLTYRPAIEISGVGNRASHNKIHDGPHNAIQLSGNDHRVEYNEIFNVCTESDDVGAFYSGRSWVDRGTIVRYNYFHHIGSAEGRFNCGSRVVYLDDAASGFTVTGNIFYKAGSMCAINVGGGRDNIIDNNIFIDCKQGVIIDTRGVDWAKHFIAEGGEWGMYEKLNEAQFDRPPYSTRYPKLAAILKDAPAEPRGNQLSHNLAVRTPLLDMPESYQHLLIHKDNWSTDSDSGFENFPKADFRLKKDGPVFTHIPGFEPIPFAEIGLYPEPNSQR